MIKQNLYYELDIELLNINEYNIYTWQQHLIKRLQEYEKEGIEEKSRLLRLLTHPQLRYIFFMEIEKIAKQELTKQSSISIFYFYLIEALYWSQNNWHIADLITKNLIDEQPNNEDFVLLRAIFLIITKPSAPQEGLNILETFLSRNKSIEILEELAFRYEDLNLLKSYDFYSELLKIDPTNTMWNYKTAMTLFEMGKKENLELILHHLEIAIKSSPNFLLAWELKRDVLWCNYYYDEAISITKFIMNNISNTITYKYDNFYLHPFLKRPVAIIPAEELEFYHSINFQWLVEKGSFEDKDEVIHEKLETAKQANIWEEFCQQTNFILRFNSLDGNLQLFYLYTRVKKLVSITSNWFDQIEPEGNVFINKGLTLLEQKLHNKKVSKKSFQLYYEDMYNYQNTLNSKTYTPISISSFLNAIKSIIAYTAYSTASHGLLNALNDTFWSYAYIELYDNEYTRARLATNAHYILVRRLESIQKELKERELLLTTLEKTKSYSM